MVQVGIATIQLNFLCVCVYVCTVCTVYAYRRSHLALLGPNCMYAIIYVYIC